LIDRTGGAGWGCHAFKEVDNNAVGRLLGNIALGYVGL
jgi:hypothetical protein